jgi:hypothetical protein
MNTILGGGSSATFGGATGAHTGKPTVYQSGKLYGPPYDGFDETQTITIRDRESLSVPFFSQGHDFDAVRLAGGASGRPGQIKIFRDNPNGLLVGEKVFESAPVDFNNTSILFDDPIFFEPGWYNIIVGVHSSSSVLSNSLVGPQIHVSSGSGRYGGPLNMERGMPPSFSSTSQLFSCAPIVDQNIADVEEGSAFNTTISGAPFFVFLRAA